MTFPHVDSVCVAELPADFSDSVVLLDVREADEWQLGHAPSAVHIPMGDVPARFGEIDPDAHLYVICRQGGRSARVVEYLQQVGYESVNVRGGMVAWQKAGLPLVSDGSAEAKIY